MRSAVSTHTQGAADTEGVAQEGGCGVAAAVGVADADKDTAAGSTIASHRRTDYRLPVYIKNSAFVCLFCLISLFLCVSPL